MNDSTDVELAMQALRDAEPEAFDEVAPERVDEYAAVAGAPREEIRTISDSPSGGNAESAADDTSGGIFSPQFKQKLRQLLEARDKYAEADAARKAAKSELDELELDVFDMFEGLQGQMDGGKKVGSTIPVPLGEPYGVVKFRTRETHYAKIADEDAFLEWLNERAMTEEVSGTSFVKRRLHEIVREAIENNESPPPGLTYYTDRGMTITRQK